MYLTNQELFANLFEDTTFELLTEIGETLRSIGYTSLGVGITEIVSQDYSDNGKRDDILATYVEALVSVLSQYGVRINEEKYSDISTLHDIIRLLINIEQNENHEDILAILESETDPLQTLVNLSDYLKELPWVTLYDTIASIHPILIKRIKDKHESVDEVMELGVVGEQQQRVVTFLRSNLVKEAGELLVKVNNLSFGFDPDAIFSLYGDSILTLNNKQMAANLMLLAMASNLSDERVIPYVEKWLERHCDSASKVIDVSSLLTKV